MINDNEITEIGKFQKTHALKGELNAILEVDPEFFEEGNAAIVNVDGIFVPFYVAGIRPKGSTSFLIRLEGIESEEEAKQFVNKSIYALKSELAPFLEIDEEELGDDSELIGYEIVDNDSGTSIGRIDGIDDSTHNLLFIVITDNGEELLIPAADEFILSIDDESRIIRMSLPDGLIDLNIKSNKNN